MRYARATGRSRQSGCSGPAAELSAVGVRFNTAFRHSDEIFGVGGAIGEWESAFGWPRRGRSLCGVHAKVLAHADHVGRSPDSTLCISSICHCDGLRQSGARAGGDASPLKTFGCRRR